MSANMDPLKLWIAFMQSDIAVAYLPALYFRIKLAPEGGHFLLTALAAAAVAWFTLVLFADDGGTWMRLVAVVCAQTASFAIFQPLTLASALSKRAFMIIVPLIAIAIALRAPLTSALAKLLSAPQADQPRRERAHSKGAFNS